MPYINFKVTEGSNVTKHYCKIDGSYKDFDDGDYIEVCDGTHIVSFEGESAIWNLQESVQGNECIRIVVAIGPEYGSFRNIVIGSPEYGVFELDENMLLMIKKMEEIETNKYILKSSKQWMALSVILMLHGIPMLIAGFTFGDIGIFMIFLGISMLIIIPNIFIFNKMKKRKKNAEETLDKLHAKR